MAGSTGQDEGGASTVEFALVSTLLFLMLFGTLQYGLFFHDSISVRQGVREAARQGVVENFAPCGTTTTGTATGTATNSGRLQCAVREQIGALTGSVYVKVAASSGWKKGSPLTVCAAVQSDGGVGLLPMPNGGWIRSKTQMSIEQEANKAFWSDAADALPAGQTWSWCS